MQNNWRNKLKRVISVVITAVLVLQGFLPSGFIGISPASAASNTWNFTTPANYGTGNQTTIFDGQGMFNMTWDTTTGNFTGDTGIGVYDLFSPPTEGLVWAVLDTLELFKSTDSGDNWSVDTGPATFLGREFVLTDGDGDIDYMVFGQDSLAFDDEYGTTTDDGDTWGAGDTPGSQTLMAGTHDSGDNFTWAIEDDGTVQRTSNAGDTWDAEKDSLIVNAYDIMWESGNTVWAVGDGGASDGIISFSTNSGVTWTKAVTEILETDPYITIGLNNGRVYFASTDSVLTIASGDDPEVAGNWTDISTNINSGNFSNVGKFLSVNNTMFVTLFDTTDNEPRVYSTIDNGTDWHEHGDSGAYRVSPTDLIRLYNGGGFLWGTSDSSGNSDTITAEFYETDDSIITLSGISATSISAIDVTYHANSEITDVGLALGFDTEASDTWYYWDSVSTDWISTTTDSYAKSNAETVFDTNIGTFDEDIGFSGDVYIKMYLREGPDVAGPDDSFDEFLIIVDSIAITYELATVSLTSPVGGETWNVGNNYDITWEFSSGFGPVNVSLYYSINSGDDWITIDESAPSTSPYSWLIPEESDNARVKITAGGAASSFSAIDFRMVVASGGSNQDQTAPTSIVDNLSSYTTNSQFNIFVDAFDTGGAGLNTVDLYYSSSEEDVIYLLNTWNIMDPNRTQMQNNKVVFNFDTTAMLAWGDGQYNFYSCATDFLENSSCGEKNLPYEGDTLPTIETSTIVDTISPSIQSAVPSNLNTQAGTDQDVIINFSESIDTSSFAYQFYTTDTNENVVDTNVVWSNNDTQINIEHPTLEYDTWYTFIVVNAKDMAGSNLTESATPQEWYFQTPIRLDPDMTNSTITASMGTNSDNSFNTGDTVDYTITLINASDLSSANTNISLTLNRFLQYKTGSANSSSGTITLQQQGGEINGLKWNGIVNKGSDIEITFKATIADAVDSFQIHQNILIADNINADFVPAPAIINVASKSNFVASNIIVDKIAAPAKASLRYTATVTNTGETIAQTAITNTIPTGLTYIRGTLNTNSEQIIASYNETQNRIEMIAIIPIGDSITFGYSVKINSELETGYVLINSVTAQDIANSDNIYTFNVQTEIDNSILLSPELSQLSPSPNATGLALDSEIDIDFNLEIDPTTFEFDISFEHYNQQSLGGWEAQWSLNNTHLKLVPPQNLSVGATYAVDIIKANDLDGNALATGAFSNSWTFTTVSPSIVIVEEEPLKMVEQGQLGGPITVQMVDAITNEPYVSPDDLTVKINSNSITGKIMIKNILGELAPTTRVTILADTSEAEFFYTNPKTSLPSFDILTMYETPSMGFPDVRMAIVITNVPIVVDPRDSLEIVIPDKVIEDIDTYSEPLLVKAKDIFGETTTLPETLYFHSDSKTGKFYDGDLEELPTGVQTLAIDSTNDIQYFKSQYPLNSAVFYYRDTTPGSSIITIADNPLSNKETGYVITAPDIGFRNVSAVMEVLKTIEYYKQQPNTTKLANIKAVNDNSGRVLNKIKILPTNTTMLPDESKTFYAQGYDNSGRAIEGLKFKWYTPSNGGTIDTDNAEKVVFTANSTVGTYFDAAMVVALYNGEIKYASTDIRITDVVEYERPTRLPVSGWNGLQLIFMALTLVAAVLLAWVESYEKSHFKPDKKKA